MLNSNAENVTIVKIDKVVNTKSVKFHFWVQYTFHTVSPPPSSMTVALSCYSVSRVSLFKLTVQHLKPLMD